MKSAWSFSSLNDYMNCPRAYQLKRVTKECTQTETEVMRHGTIQHEHLELRVRDKKELPPELVWMEAHIQKLEGSGGTLIAEQAVGLTKGLTPTGFFSNDVWVRGKLDLSVEFETSSVVLDWKGLPLTTELPTPDGFVTMGDIAVGDTLFSSNGHTCKVMAKSAVTSRPCYKISFDDKTSVVCDNVHLWKLSDGSVVPVTELKVGHKIEVCKATCTALTTLPLDPYVLGLWLADGKHTSSEITKPDDFVWAEIQRRGYAISHNYSEKAEDGKCRVHTVKGIRGLLKQLGVLGNKHIPQEYLFAGLQQRLDLLRGLMDGDGNVNPVRKQAVFTTTDKAMSDQVMILLSSLGQRASQTDVKSKGFGLVIRAYPIAFRPLGINPFLLPRKADKIMASWGAGNSWRRKVVCIEAAPTQDTQCIAVDSLDNTFLCTKRFIPTHNTGKRKFDSDQLMLFAGFEFAARPEIEKVKTGYVWLKEQKIDSTTFTRSEVPHIWGHFMPKVERLERSYEKDEWPAKSSGLCGWCPANKSQCKNSKR